MMIIITISNNSNNNNNNNNNNNSVFYIHILTLLFNCTLPFNSSLTSQSTGHALAPCVPFNCIAYRVSPLHNNNKNNNNNNNNNNNTNNNNNNNNNNNEFKLCYSRSMLSVFYFRMSFIFDNSHIRLEVLEVQTRSKQIHRKTKIGNEIF